MSCRGELHSLFPLRETMTITRLAWVLLPVCIVGFAPVSVGPARAALDTIDRLRRRPDASNAPEVAMLMVTRAELAEAIKAMEEGVRRRRRARRRDRVAARQRAHNLILFGVSVDLLL